jgi:hypothetical protein
MVHLHILVVWFYEVFGASGITLRFDDAGDGIIVNLFTNTCLL